MSELGSFDHLKTNRWRYSNINFRLQTLYCNNILDLPRIIRSQNELQILGIYNNCHKESFMESLKRLQNAQLHLPVVVTLEQESYFPFDKISIFPAFYSSDRCSTFHQVLAESFEKDRGSSDIWTYVGGVFELFIYLVDSCDMPSIHALTKSMAMRFPQINSLTFCFEHQCDIVRFLLIIIIPELRNVSGITGNEENCLPIP